MILEKKKVGGFKVVGLSIKTSNEEGRAVDHINALWQFFMTENILDKLPARVDDTIYAVYSEYEGDHERPYKFSLGVRVDEELEIPEGMDGVDIPIMTYARGKAKGEQVKALVDLWTVVWESDLARSYKVDFEVYGAAFFDPKLSQVDLYLSIEDDA